MIALWEGSRAQRFQISSSFFPPPPPAPHSVILGSHFDMGVSSERPISDRLCVPILGNYSSITEVTFRSLHSDWKLGSLSPHAKFIYPLAQRPSLGRSARGKALALWKNFPLFYSLAYNPALCESLNATALPRVAGGGDAVTIWGWLQTCWVSRRGLPASLGFERVDWRLAVGIWLVASLYKGLRAWTECLKCDTERRIDVEIGKWGVSVVGRSVSLKAVARSLGK